MTDLVIVNPAASHGIYGPLGEELIAVEPPLWCRLLAAYIRKTGHSVKIIDAEALNLDGKAAALAAIAESPRLVCVAVYGHQPSASTQQMWGARRFCMELVKLSPDIKTIMVGGHPSALPERTFLEEVVDYVGIGEGPLTIRGLLDGDPLEVIPGLVWRYRDTVFERNPSAPLLPLHELSGDAWDLLPMDRYRAHNWQCLAEPEKRMPYASIYTSLGCPFGCVFCCINAPFESNRYRMRDPLDVVNEIVF